jgi:hypothetical protein
VLVDWQNPVSVRVKWAYQMVFAGIFEFALKRWRGDADMASWMAFCCVSGAMMANLLFFVVLVAGVAEIRPAPTALFATLQVLIVLVNYLGTLRAHRYCRFVERRRELPPSERLLWTRIGFGYLLSSFGLPILLGWILT